MRMWLSPQVKASALLCPQDHACHPVGESSAKSAHAAWKRHCRASSSWQKKAKSGELGDRASRELLPCRQGVGGLQAPGPQQGLFPVSSPPPGQIWAPVGLLPQSPGQASDIRHRSAAPGGHVGPAPAQDRALVLCKCSRRPSGARNLVLFVLLSFFYNDVLPYCWAVGALGVWPEAGRVFFTVSPGAPLSPLRPPGLAGLAGSVSRQEQLLGGYVKIKVYGHGEVPPQQLLQAGIEVTADIAVPRAQLP